MTSRRTVPHGQRWPRASPRCLGRAATVQRNRSYAARRVDHHRRTCVHQPVHCEHDKARSPARLTVCPNEIVGVLVGRDRGGRREAEHRACSGSSHDSIGRPHRAPPSKRAVVSAISLACSVGSLGPRIRSYCGDQTVPVLGRRPTPGKPADIGELVMAVRMYGDGPDDDGSRPSKHARATCSSSVPIRRQGFPRSSRH
jgi:hypothetical protein